MISVYSVHELKFFYLQIDEITLHVTLSDFGLSKVMTETAQIGTRTMLAGTPGFQPPEQLQAQSIGIHCDVYAVGAVVLVLFTERPLWPSLTPFQIMHKVTIENEKPDTTSLPPNLVSVCSKCFEEMNSRPLISVILKELINIVKD